jgi:hypothetical protein
MAASTLESFLAQKVLAPLQVINEKERSVAGAWNRGIEIAYEAGLVQYLITAVDVSITPATVDCLLEFESRNADCDLWSSTPMDIEVNSKSASCDGHDFSCFMLRYKTIETHGWFDKEYKPAYFEDDDYVTRMVLAGSNPKRILNARHVHAGSLTIRLDADMAHHVKHWFEINKSRFYKKWGYKTDDFNRLRERCHKSPFNSGKSLHWWPEQDREGYCPSGGIHE